MFKSINGSCRINVDQRGNRSCSEVRCNVCDLVPHNCLSGIINHQVLNGIRWCEGVSCTGTGLANICTFKIVRCSKLHTYACAVDTTCASNKDWLRRQKVEILLMLNSKWRVLVIASLWINKEVKRLLCIFACACKNKGVFILIECHRRYYRRRNLFILKKFYPDEIVVHCIKKTSECLCSERCNLNLVL